MSAIEDRRIATAEVARQAREALVAAEREARAARAEQRQVEREQAKIALAAKIASERANYDAFFGSDSEWIGVDVEFNGDNMSVSVYSYTEFKESVSFSREEAVAFRDFINEKIK